MCPFELCSITYNLHKYKATTTHPSFLNVFFMCCVLMYQLNMSSIVAILLIEYQLSTKLTSLTRVKPSVSR